MSRAQKRPANPLLIYAHRLALVHRGELLFMFCKEHASSCSMSTSSVSQTTGKHAQDLTRVGLGQHFDTSNPFDPLKAATAWSYQTKREPMLVRERFILYHGNSFFPFQHLLV
jgi:hypothetical protein